jgi:hypothetical protein
MANSQRDFHRYNFASLNKTKDSVGSVFQRNVPRVQDRIRGELKPTLSGLQ